MNIREHAMVLGIDKGALFMLRHNNPDSFDEFISIGHGSLSKGIIKVKELYYDTRDKYERLLLVLESIKRVTKFSEHLYTLGYYKHPMSFSNYKPRTIDYVSPIPRLVVVKKLTSIVDELFKFLITELDTTIVDPRNIPTVLLTKLSKEGLREEFELFVNDTGLGHIEALDYSYDECHNSSVMKSKYNITVNLLKEFLNIYSYH